MDYIRWKQIGEKNGYLRTARIAFVPPEGEVRPEIKAAMEEDLRKHVMEFLLRNQCFIVSHDGPVATFELNVALMPQLEPVP